MKRKDVLDEIEKDYEAYRLNGGHLSILAFTTRWLKEHKEVLNDHKGGFRD